MENYNSQSQPQIYGIRLRWLSKYVMKLIDKNVPKKKGVQEPTIKEYNSFP